MADTKVDITSLPAGRELDALVAEKVMGWKWGAEYKTVDGNPVGWWEEPGSERLHWGCYKLGEMPPTVPYYSTEIKDAWEVVERFKRDERQVQIGRHGQSWSVGLGGGWGFDESAPLAIVRAALRTVGL